MELELKRWLVTRLGGVWHSSVEPAHGSDRGVPDLLVLLPQENYPVPVELKVARSLRSRRADTLRYRPLHLRAGQIAWHDGLARAGGRSCILLGYPQQGGGFLVWCQADCRRETLAGWRKGWRPAELACILHPGMERVDTEAWRDALIRSRGPTITWHGNYPASL